MQQKIGGSRYWLCDTLILCSLNKAGYSSSQSISLLPKGLSLWLGPYRIAQIHQGNGKAALWRGDVSRDIWID